MVGLMGFSVYHYGQLSEFTTQTSVIITKYLWRLHYEKPINKFLRNAWIKRHYG